MSRLLVVLALILLALSARAEPMRPEVGPLVQGNNTFAMDLFGRLRHQEGNIVFSPYGVSSSLALTSFGARGRTLDELNRTVHLLDQDSLHLAYQSLNKVYAHGDDSTGLLRMTAQSDLRGYRGTTFNPAFLQVARQSYGGPRDPGDHIDTNPLRLVKADANEDAAAEALPVRPANDDSLPLVLVSSVNFEVAKGSKLADPTKPGSPFIMADGKQLRVPYLTETGLFACAETKDVQVVELPYAKSDMRLDLILPRKAADLPQIEKGLDLESLSQLVNRITPREVTVTIPRCRITSDGSLKKPLIQLGLGNLFGTGADLSGLSDASKSVYLGDIIHRAAIDIGACNNDPLPPRPSTRGVKELKRATPLTFEADHPFLFVLRDASTGAILLMGRVADPAR